MSDFFRISGLGLRIFSLHAPPTHPPIDPMQVLPHTHRCFVCGESNPIGLKLRFETDGRLVRTRFVPKPEHIGFQQVVHGGILATLMDEIMVWACAVQTKRFGFCAELNVRFLKPAEPDKAIDASAELTANRKDRIFEAKAELKNEAGEVLATATGKYLPIKASDSSQFLSDVVGDVSWLT